MSRRRWIFPAEYSGGLWAHNIGSSVLEVKLLAKDVMCMVENCRFWNERKCEASAIEVNVDGGGHTAGYTGETNCHTFVAKE